MRIVVGVVVIEDDKVLLIREAKDKCRGQWNFPAGHLDDGEYILDAAVREAREETGYGVELKELVGVLNQKDQARPQFFFFTGEIKNGDGVYDPEEIMDMRWVPLNELDNYEMRMPKEEVNEIFRRIEDGELYPLEVIKEF